MHPSLIYTAIACTECQRTSLVLNRTEPPFECPRCGAASLLVPGVEYTRDDLALFNALELIVHRAELPNTSAVLIAAELDGVSSRWEPPELVLDRLAPRLPGLRGCFSRTQDYAQLLLVVSILLAVICARLQTRAKPPQLARRQSGIHLRYRPELVEEPLASGKKMR